MIDANNLVFDFYYIQSNSLCAESKSATPYTNVALRERIKDRIMAGSEGGRPGQWSARKAQLLAQRYRAAGGGYKKGKKPTEAQSSLRRWTNEKWRTSDNKPALRGGRMRRYLPDKVWDRLTPAQRRATNAKKIRGDRSGRQFVANTEVAARRARMVRMRSKVLGRAVGQVSEVDGDGDGFITGPDGQDNIPAPAAVATRVAVDALKPQAQAAARKVHPVLSPAPTIAEARRLGQPWSPLTRDKWTPELRQGLDDMVEYERSVAKAVWPLLQKLETMEGLDRNAAHSFRSSVLGSGYGTSDVDYWLRTELQNLGPEIAESKEAKDFVAWVRKNGIPGHERLVQSRGWARQYRDYIRASLEKEGAALDDPLYKAIQGRNSRFVEDVEAWLLRHRQGLTGNGKVYQFLKDLRSGTTPKDADVVAKELVSKPERRIAIQMGATTLGKFLEDGRYKNLFENNGFNAFVDDRMDRERVKFQLSARLIAEQLLFGIPIAGHKKSAHPIYGFFHAEGPEDIRDHSVFGKISVVMKRGVEERSTMTAGDSLAGQFLGTSPLNAPDGIGVRGGWAGSVNDRMPNFSDPNMIWFNAYHEAQIFGGVKVSDISYVAVPQDYQFPNPEIEQKLKDLGIPIVRLPKEGKFEEPDELKVKAASGEVGELIATSDDMRLYETGDDAGYIQRGSRRTDVSSVSAVLKFGSWILNSPPNNRGSSNSKIRAKILGKPIGGISEVDGDGDGFVTGPTGEDNVPAPVAAAVREAVSAAASARKPSTRPKGSAKAPSSDSRTGKVSEIIGKIGKRMIGLSEPTKKKNLKSGELFPIVAADARQIVLSVRNNPRVMGLLMARYSSTKYPDDHLKMLEAAEKAVRTGKPDLMMRDPDVKEVLQTANIVQLAEDMKALGVDEEMAKRVLEQLIVSEYGSLAWKWKQERVAAGQEFAADNGVEAPLWTHVLAGALRDSWAESSNDHQEISLAMQEIAAKLMASLGESRPFVKAEDVISKEENARSAKGVAKLLADAEVRNVMETFLSSQYARTQEMFEHHGIETVELHRGMDHVEIAKAIRTEHKEKVDAMVSDLRENVQKAAGDEYAEFLSVDAELTKFEKDLKNRIMRSDEERDAAQNRLAMLRAQRTNLIRKIRDKTRPVIEDHVAQFRKFEKENGLDDFDAAMRPLSSWTSDAMMGNYFSIIGGEERLLPQPIVLTSTLDRKDILSTVLNGIGAIQEDEIVTMTPIAKSSARIGPLGKIEERPQYGQQEILGSTRGMSIVSLIEDLNKHLKFFKGFENLNMPILNLMKRWGDR